MREFIPPLDDLHLPQNQLSIEVTLIFKMNRWTKKKSDSLQSLFPHSHTIKTLRSRKNISNFHFIVPNTPSSNQVRPMIASLYQPHQILIQHKMKFFAQPNQVLHAHNSCIFKRNSWIKIGKNIAQIQSWNQLNVICKLFFLNRF